MGCWNPPTPPPCCVHSYSVVGTLSLANQSLGLFFCASKHLSRGFKYRPHTPKSISDQAPPVLASPSTLLKKLFRRRHPSKYHPHWFSQSSMLAICSSCVEWGFVRARRVQIRCARRHPTTEHSGLAILGRNKWLGCCPTASALSFSFAFRVRSVVQRCIGRSNALVFGSFGAEEPQREIPIDHPTLSSARLAPGLWELFLVLRQSVPAAACCCQ